jgi:hypothetical protein
MKKILILVLLSAFLFSCKNDNKVEKVERAFYYWKSDAYSIQDEEEEQLDTLNIKKLYVKFFEVKFDETLGNIPFSKTSLRYDEYDFSYNKKNSLYKCQIIPTVFIKNEVFLKSSTKQIDTLVSNVNHLINKYYSEKFVSFKKFNEIQIDCDWTLKSKENYFYFLKQLSKKTNVELSCTLRLYPYKYRTKMGIPPVKKVTLMCYNLIQPFAQKGKNSILDTQELESYLTADSKYPLHLDIVLPIYSWGFHYQYDKFSGFFDCKAKDLDEFCVKKSDLWYEVSNDTTINDVYFRIGDKIKYESVSKEVINRTISILKSRVDFDNTATISLFHLNSKTNEKYSYETLSNFYTAFSK